MNPPVIAGSVLTLSNQTRGVQTDHYGLGPRHWQAQLRRLGRSGFTAVDLVDGWLPIPDLSSSELEQLGQVLSDEELTPVGLNVSRHSLIDAERGAENLDYSCRGVDAAAALGAGVLEVGFHPRLVPEQKGQLMFWEVEVAPDDRSEETWAVAADRLRQLCSYAGDRGVHISIELYEDTLVCTAADIDKIISAVGADNLGINPDLGNTFRSVTPQREHWLDTFRGALPHLDLWHLKNYTRASLGPQGPFAIAPTALGEGMIDYRLLVGEALRAGFTGPYVVEHYGGDAQTTFGADFVPAAQLAQAQGNPQVGNRLVTSGDGALNYLALNTQRGDMKNKEVRQALNYAIDRTAFITASGGTKSGDPATTLITPGIAGRQVYDLYPAGADGNIAKAKQLLSDAGHASDLSFTLVVSNQPIELAQAQAIQQALAKVDVKITLRPLDGNAVIDLVTQGKGDYDMYLGSWQPDFPSANGNIQPLFDSSQIGDGGYNTSRYANPAVDKLIAQATQAVDQSAAQSLWAKADKKIMADAPVIPLSYAKNSFLHGSKVQNFYIGEFPAYPNYLRVSLAQ